MTHCNARLRHASLTPDKRKRFVASVLSVWLSFSALFGAPLAFGAAELGLNKVWTRLVDINGELGSVESSEFSPDSEYIVAGTKYDYTVRVFRTSDGEQMWRTKLPQEIERVAWTADGKFVVSVSEDKVMRVLNAKNGKIVKEIRQEAGMDGLVLSNDGSLMVSGAESQDEGKKISDAPANIYSTKDWRLIRSVNHGATINEVDFTSDDKYLITAGHPYVKVWETATGKLIDTYDTTGKGGSRPYDGFVAVQIRYDDKYVIAGSGQGNLYFFELKEDGKLKFIRKLNKTGRKIETVAWTPEGKYAAIAGHSSNINFFAMEHVLNKKMQSRYIPFALQVPVTDNLEYMEFNDAGTLFTTAHQDGTIQLWVYMSDDPMVNQRRHQAVKKAQEQANKK